ncbi:MAG: recombinase, partial [Macromonas sp.]
MPTHQQLLALLTALNANAPLAQRHLWLIRVVAWVRGEATDVRAALARVNQLLDAVQADPELQQRWQNWWGVFSATLDMTPLLADFGFAPRTAFLSEFGRRLSLKLLPSTPETTDSSELFGLVFSHPFDVRWLRALDTPTLERMRQLLLADPLQTHAWQVTLLDAVVFAASQISATGFAAEIRGRMSPEVLQRRPFHGLPQCLERWRSAVLMHGPHSPSAADAVQALQAQLEACRRATHTVYAHLEEHGISVGIVFRLRQLRERVLRIHMLLDALHSAQPARATVALLADLVQLGRDNRSLRALLSSSTQLMAAKVAERSAETGEHYITRNRAEHRQMLRYAAGGGAVLGLTTWGKFAL